MSAQDEIDRLRREVEDLQLSKLELIRSTSAELERMRQTIRFLTGKTDLKTVNSIGYSPLTATDKKYVSSRVSSQHPPIDLENIVQGIVENQQREFMQQQTQERENFQQQLEQQQYEFNKQIKEHQRQIELQKQETTQLLQQQKQQLQSQSQTRGSTDDSQYNNNIDNNIDNSNNYDNYNNNNNNSNTNDRGLSTINEDESQSDESRNNSKSDKKVQISSSAKNNNGKKKDSSYRLSIKRMSRQGYIFSELGFMTTDFEQLQRGHTQWVNHVIHHPIQNGICISASNDSCIFFWRMREYLSQKEELQQEKYDARILRYSNDHNQQSAMIAHCKANAPHLQAIHQSGETKLHPLLKINTGVQIKGITMSKEGNILACVCYDDEEEETDPELELYYDEEQLWCFQQDHMDYGDSKNAMKGGRSKDRIIRRKVIPLPFPPIDRGVQFTNDSKFVFIGLESTKDREIDSDDDDSDDGKRNDDWPEEACTLVCIDVTTRMVRPCQRINELMYSNEFVRCFNISPDGQRIAIGTSLGRLIVTGVKHLTGAYDLNDGGLPDGNENASLWRIWIGDDISNGNNDNQTINGNVSVNAHINNNNTSALEGNIDGGLSAIAWSGDSEWLITGYYTGSIKLWKKNKEPRLSINVNKALNIMMKRAHVPRKSKLFTCKWMLEGLHVESINSFSINGSLLLSGSDDGTIIIHDLCQTFIDNNSAHMPRGNVNNNNINYNSNEDDNTNENGSSKNGKNKNDDLSNNSPSTLGKIERLHGGRMVTSVSLTPNYGEESLLVPTAGLYMVSSGADNVIHCLSLLGVLRNSIRTKFYNQRL